MIPGTGGPFPPGSDPTGHGGPIITDSDSRSMRWLFVGLSLLVLVIGGVATAVLLPDSTDDSATPAAVGSEGGVGSGGGVGSAGGGPGGNGQGAGGQGSPPSEDVAFDLFTDPMPAIRSFRQAVGGTVVARELVLYPDYAILEYQDQAQPTHIDRVLWRRGGLSPPDPVTLSQGFTPEVEASLFDAEEVRFRRLDQMTADALALFDHLGAAEVTHVIVNRFLPWDEDVNVRVYVDDRERGGGGYVRFRPGGALIEVVG
jgi:hypothetical protein